MAEGAEGKVEHNDLRSNQEGPAAVDAVSEGRVTIASNLTA